MAPELTRDLERENQELRARLAEAEEAIRALAAGEVDAFVVPGTDGDQVYTLKGADEAYRVMVQGMAEGAVTLARDGLILFANQQFAELVRTPLEHVIGAHWQDFVSPPDSGLTPHLLAVKKPWKIELRLDSGHATPVPVYVSVESLVLNGEDRLCVIVTDLSEQKRNEEMLASEKLTRSILEQSAEAILVVDANGRITYASHAAEQLGETPILQSYLGEAFAIKLDSGVVLTFPVLLAMTQERRILKNVEAVVRRPDGRIVDFLLSSALLSGADGALVGCVINLTDITERKRSEAQLRFQAAIIDTTAEAVIAIDPGNRVTFWNAGAERIYGVSKGEILGRSLTDAYQYGWPTPEDEALAEDALARRGVWSGENTHVRRDGSKIFVSSTVNIIDAAYGGGMFAIVRDVTEVKRAQALLEASEARERARAAEYQAIMDAVPAAVFIARDPDCLEILGNRMSYELLQMEGGANISKSAPEEQKPNHFQESRNNQKISVEDLPMQRAARTGQPVQDYEFELVFNHGAARFWLGNAVPLFDEKGARRGAVGAFVDITERKRADLAIQKHAAELARVNEDLLHFAYAVSHDLQAPLRSATSFAQLLALRSRAKLDEPANQMLNMVVEANLRMGAMLRDLLQFARVAGADLRIDETVPLEEILEIVLDNLRSAIDESAAVITHDPLPALKVDRNQCIQLLQNIIGNSLKYRKPGTPPRIHVSSRQENGDWVISVSDNGIGFEPAYKDRIFQVFQRLHRAEFAGTGIGLAICKRIVERHGGRIWADGRPDEGATFSFSIPADISQARLEPRLAEVRPAPEQANPPMDAEHIGELLHALDLAPAIVRKLDGTISLWTEGSQRLFGWAKADALGKRSHDLLRTEFPLPLREIEAELLRQGEWKGQVRVVRSDGARVWLSSQWAIYRDGAGRPQSVIEVHTDITALKDAEEALRRSSRQRDLALQAGRMGVWRLDARTGAVEWDAAILGFHEIPSVSFEGTREAALRLIHPDDAPRVETEAAEALRQGSDYAVEYRALRADNTVFWVRSQGKVVRNGDEVEGMLGVAWDITDRKSAEEQLSASHALAASRLREIEAIYSNAPVGLVHLDRDLRFVRINEHLAEMNGLPAHEHIGHRVGEFLPSIEWLEPILRKVMETRQPIVNNEYRGVLPGSKGPESIWLVSYYPLEDSEGQVIGLNGVVQDITERKTYELALKAAAERLSIATAAARLGVLHWNRKDESVSWENPRMYEIFGQPLDAGPISRREFFESVVHPDDAVRVRTATSAALRGGGVLHEVCRIRRGDGALRWIELNAQPEFDASGEAIRLTGVAADVTDRIVAEQALQDRQQHVRNILDSLQTFVGVLSPEGTLLDANRAPLEAAGIQPADVIGKPLAETFWWSYSPGVQRKIQEAVDRARSGESSRFDIEARMKDGQLMSLDWMISPLRDPDGGTRYLIASAISIEERKRMEAALRLSEERYRLAEWATNDGLWDWDPATDYCYFSPRFKALFGFEDSEFENNATFAFSRLHPDDEAPFFEALRRHVEEHQPYDVEFRAHRKDGAYRWFRSRGQVLRDASGKVVRMVGALSDIHDRKQAEALARDQDEQLRLMIDSFDQLAWIARGDGYIFWYNRRWYEYTGTTPEQMEGWGWQAVHHPEALPKVMEAWQLSIRTGQPFKMEFPIRGADGVFRSFLTRVQPVRDSQGNVFRWFGTNTDIDALRKEQNVLRESERQFRELAEALPDLLWTGDAQGNVTYWNPQLGDYTGLSQGAPGDRWVSVIHPDDAPHVAKLWMESVATGRHHECESRMRRHDGVYRWFLHRAEPIRDQSGKITKWIGTSTDIHEQKLTEQKLRRLNEDLEQFAFAASHDLQEPLRNVSIYSQMLSQRYGGNDPEGRQFASYVVSGTKQMQSLLRAILAYSQAGDLIEGPAVSESAAAFAIAAEHLQLATGESGATISLGDLPAVAIPQNAMVHLFENLIGNAIKYRAPRPLTIHVSASREGAWQKFAVADNGIGMRPEYLTHVFGVFKRLHKDEYPGVGIGLAICKRLVDRAGGKIWAESELGVGTTFYFTLPAHDAK